jgi:hypothetical protein
MFSSPVPGSFLVRSRGMHSQMALKRRRRSTRAAARGPRPGQDRGGRAVPHHPRCWPRFSASSDCGSAANAQAMSRGLDFSQAQRQAEEPPLTPRGDLAGPAAAGAPPAHTPTSVLPRQLQLLWQRHGWCVTARGRRSPPEPLDTPCRDRLDLDQRLGLPERGDADAGHGRVGRPAQLLPDGADLLGPRLVTRDVDQVDPH